MANWFLDFYNRCAWLIGSLIFDDGYSGRGYDELSSDFTQIFLSDLLVSFFGIVLGSFLLYFAFKFFISFIKYLFQ